MRNQLLMGVTVSALSFAAVPASAQVTVGAQVEVQRNQDDGYAADELEGPGDSGTCLLYTSDAADE